MTITELYPIFAVSAFCFGAIVASFLNVVIWRVPRGESIVSPPSHCPKCNAMIKWYQNIPILSWLALRGKCASCKAPISPRYVLIEALGGALYLAAFLHYGLTPFLPVAWIWLALMIVGAMIDFDHQLLPDFVTVGGMILGLVYAAYLSLAISWTPILVSLGGLAFGFGIFYLIRAAGSFVFKREAMGMGDVFLMGAVGALFGPFAVFFVLVFASLFGAVIGTTLIALSKTKFRRYIEIPFGPYICMATLLWMFYGMEILSWYLKLLRIREF